MAFPSVVTTATTAYSANQTSHTVNLPSSIASGDLLLIWFCRDNTTGSVTAPSGWTTERGPLDQSDQSYLYSKIATGSEGATVTVATSNSESSTSVALRISGRVSHVSGSSVAGSGQYANPPSVTATRSADSLVIHFGSALGNATISSSPNGDVTTLFEVGNSGDSNNTVTAFSIWAQCAVQDNMDIIVMPWHWNTSQAHRMATVLVQGTASITPTIPHPLHYTPGIN